MNIFTYTPVYIFSVSKGVDISLDKLHTDMIELAMKDLGIPVKRVLGCYEGIEQESFVINAKYKDTVLEIMHDYKQDTVLYLDGFDPRQAHYMDKDGNLTHAGVYERVLNNNLELTYMRDGTLTTINSWTKDTNGQYWSTF